MCRLIQSLSKTIYHSLRGNLRGKILFHLTDDKTTPGLPSWVYWRGRLKKIMKRKWRKTNNEGPAILGWY